MELSLPNKRYYKIGELAKAFGVNVSLLRFWDKEFDVINPKKNNKGDRMFRPEDVENFKIIFHLVKEKGYTLEGAKMQLKSEVESLKKQQDVISRLEALKKTLIEIKKEI